LNLLSEKRVSKFAFYWVNLYHYVKTVRRALANSTILALTFGGATCLGLNLFSAQVLQAMGCSPDLVTAAMPYLRIRAFAIPAVLFCTSAQGGCLGQQDARTPLLIFIIAGLVNVGGDLWAVQPWGLNMGLEGAAWATLAAQYASAFIFFIVLTRRRMLPVKAGLYKLNSVMTRSLQAPGFNP
jgi:Na+-driven multidrug efflux pump